MDSLFLGVRVPDIPYQRVCFEAINLQISLTECGLPEKAGNQFNLPPNELVFVYRGRTLESNVALQEQGVHNGSTIQVLRKVVQEDQSVADQTALTDEKLRQITSSFKRFTELSHPVVIKKVLTLYPAIRDDLGALAFLRDAILLSSMKSPENFQEIAKQYPIFLQAAPTFVEILNRLDRTKVVRVPVFDDSDSSSSSSSSEDLTANNATALINNNNNNNNNNNAGEPSGNGGGGQITQRQLADALAFVGAAIRSAQGAGGTGAAGGSNSNRESMEMVTESNEPETTSNTNPQAPAPAADVHPVGGVSQADLRARFSQELVQMYEMGLLDEHDNLQALLICNGDLEAAINLVFSSNN